MGVETELREGMAVFDETGRRVGQVEDLRDSHFFLTSASPLSLVRERIVVDASESVARVDADGAHLRHDREELLRRQMRPREIQSSRQVAPGEPASELRRGDEDRRELDGDDLREERKAREGPHTGPGPMNGGI